MTVVHLIAQGGAKTRCGRKLDHWVKGTEYRNGAHTILADVAPKEHQTVCRRCQRASDRTKASRDTSPRRGGPIG